MSTRTSPVLRQLTAAVRALLVLTVVLGVAYPLVLTGAAQVLLPGNADGSTVQRHGTTVGSDLVGQAFTRPVRQDGSVRKDADGNPVTRPDPRYFQSRPSAAGSGYDPLSTSASNLGPDNRDLVDAVRQRRAAVARLDGVPASRVPADALLASGSGLDPHVSPAYARLQVDRVARARGLDRREVSALVTDHVQGRSLGFLGEPRVNVLVLNLALDALSGRR